MESEIEQELDPGQTLTVDGLGQIGTATIPVTYKASLVGGVFSNYSSKYNGHHSYYNGIDSIMSNLNLTNSVTMGQDLNITAYVYTDTSFNVTGGSSTIVDRNPKAVRMYADPD